MEYQNCPVYITEVESIIVPQGNLKAQMASQRILHKLFLEWKMDISSLILFIPSQHKVISNFF